MNNIIEHGGKIVKHTTDAIVLAGWGANVLDWAHLPGLYTWLGVIWLLIRISETSAVRSAVDWFKSRIL